MSQTELDQSFLTSTPPTVLEEDVAIESPEIESPTVESPSLESPGLFAYRSMTAIGLIIAEEDTEKDELKSENVYKTCMISMAK